MNTFFSNIAGGLNIPEYVTNGPTSDNISDPIIKLIVKYRKNCSILTIGVLLFASFLHSSLNTSVTNSEFPSVLKQANITPVFKKGERYSTDNYRPVSILPNVPKIFERCIFCQINEYMDAFLSKYRCGFRKGYNIQQRFLAMLEKWISAVDN